VIALLVDEYIEEKREPRVVVEGQSYGA